MPTDLNEVLREIAELTAERDRWADRYFEAMGRAAELEETLLPFAEFARRNDDESNAASSGLPDSAPIAEGITLGDMRKARAVLEKKEAEHGRE